MSSRAFTDPRGPFTADQIRPGDPYELSNGHPIRCFPAGGRHSGANLEGGAVIGSDPDVESAGVDAGFSPEPGTLRAPDIAVGISKEPGWSPGAPPLALEYADRGQDEEELADKIQDLLKAGTRWIWVVRLDGPRRVEVHSSEGVRTVQLGDELTAPGVLRNPVPVKALFDRQTAHKTTFRNLLNRQGYEDLDMVREEGRQEGREEGRQEGQSAMREVLLKMCRAKGFDLDDERRADIKSCNDLDRLQIWFNRSLTAETIDDIFR